MFIVSTVSCKFVSSKREGCIGSAEGTAEKIAFEEIETLGELILQ